MHSTSNSVSFPSSTDVKAGCVVIFVKLYALDNRVCLKKSFKKVYTRFSFPVCVVPLSKSTNNISDLLVWRQRSREREIEIEIEREVGEQ